MLLTNSPPMQTDIDAHSAGSAMANPQDVAEREFSKKAFLLVKTPGTPFSASSLNGDSLGAVSLELFDDSAVDDSDVARSSAEDDEFGEVGETV